MTTRIDTVLRQWKSDGVTYPIALADAVRRIRLLEKGTPPEEIEADLRAGMVLESPCARFAVDRAALERGAAQ